MVETVRQRNIKCVETRLIFTGISWRKIESSMKNMNSSTLLLKVEKKKPFHFSVENESNLPFFHMPTYKTNRKTSRGNFDHCCHDSLHMRRRYSALLMTTPLDSSFTVA